MTLSANSSGNLSFRFLVPAGIPAGSKQITATGAGGTVASGNFIGRGEITTEQRRRVTTENYTPRADPLAQTFTSPESRHMAGVRLWFTTAGTHEVRVQIRETSVGFPTRVVLAEGVIAPSAIALNGSPTQILFSSPVWLTAGVDYAIVVMTDDANAAVSVAKLGGFDSTLQRRITSQPYLGVLLSSSDGVTWTAHQDKDLTFELLAARFTQTERTINLGSVTLNYVSDILANFTAETPANGTSAELVLTVGSDSYHLVAGMPAALPTRLNGSASVSIVLSGSEKVSPVLYPGIQFVAGDQRATGTYVSRAFDVGNNARLSITFNASVSGAASAACAVQNADGTWQTLSITSANDMGDGVVERKYVLTGFTATTTRVKLSLSGTAANRPRLSKLRAVSTD